MGIAILVLLALADDRHVMDAPVPPAPELPPSAARFRSSRALGTSTTLYVNFDGVELGDCVPSSSKNNCHWYNNERALAPFSGPLAARVSVLQAMRHDVSDFGIRVTGQRPPESEDYTMVIYGGTEAEYGALGSAPAGDCGDRQPNDIAFAHVDGPLATWVNGGATTALHEAAHTWGLDHIDVDQTIMFPSGDDSPVSFRDSCERVVGTADLQARDASCPELNHQHCSDGNRQNSVALLHTLFGPPYVDMTAPQLILRAPDDGEYFQAPATFDVDIGIVDDLHPQQYEIAIWLEGESEPEASKTLDPAFRVVDLPLGSWTVHVRVRDHAGNASRLTFDVEVGDEPPPDGDAGCGCRAGRQPAPLGHGLAGLAVVALYGRSRTRLDPRRRMS